MKTINKEMYQALENAIIDEYSCFDHMAMFQAMEYILGIIDIDDLEYDNTLRAVNRVLEECEPDDEEYEDEQEEFELVHDPNDYEYTPEEAEMLGLKWDPILKMYI